MRCGLARALQAIGEEADRVVVLGMHHDQRAVSRATLMTLSISMSTARAPRRS